MPRMVQSNNETADNALSSSPIRHDRIQHEPANDFKPGVTFKLAFAALAVLAMMVALDSTSVSVALPIIAQKLHGTAIEAFWTGTSFLLSSTVFQPSIASFSHVFGRMPLILWCVACFMVGVIVSGVAKDFTTILVGRTIQGIGGGGILALTEIVITDLVPLRLRGGYYGLISGVWAVGSVTGPIIGGAFAQKVTWRWIFWINLPFIGIAWVLVPLFIKLNLVPGSVLQKIRRIDWTGNIVFVAAATSFIVPISWGGVQYPWSSWHTLVPLIVGALAIIAFSLYEIYVPSEPMIRFQVFSNRNVAHAYLGAFIHAMVVFSFLYFLPLYYEGVKGFSPILAGVALFPETFTVAPASVVCGVLISKLGRYRWSVWCGWALTVLGTGLLYLMDVHTSTAAWIWLNIVPGLGTGLLYTALNLVLQAATDDQDMDFAVSMFTFFRSLGQCMGVAICGAIFQNQMKKKLLSYPALAPMASKYARDAQSLVQVIKTMPNTTDKQDLIQAYADSLKTVWIVMCALSALAMFQSFTMRSLSLDRVLTGDQGYKEHIQVTDVEKSGNESGDGGCTLMTTG